MILVVDPHSGIPVYRQIVEQIRFHVASGVLKPGEEIPSTRALSASLGVNPMTISKAFVLLEEAKILERRPGRPHVVRTQGRRKILATRQQQLEHALRPVVTKARQLDLDTDTTLQVFRSLLEDDTR